MSDFKLYTSVNNRNHFFFWLVKGHDVLCVGSRYGNSLKVTPRRKKNRVYADDAGPYLYFEGSKLVEWSDWDHEWQECPLYMTADSIHDIKAKCHRRWWCRGQDLAKVMNNYAENNFDFADDDIDVDDEIDEVEDDNLQF